MRDLVATYRVQACRDFRFDQVAGIVPYLADMGISHLYLSPLFESVPGSNHGYDVTDFNQVSTERGGEDALLHLDRMLSDHDMGLILDIVPNHMATHETNPYWMDVLGNGRESLYWHLFDMRVPPGEKIRLPVRGQPLHAEIEQRNIAVIHQPEGDYIRFYDALYPLRGRAEGSWEDILDRQHYEFAPWRDVFKSLSYRRFFDVTGLIGVRVEDEDVFQLTHAKLFDLKLKLTSLAGVRVDHIDGLADPAGYLARLHEVFGNIWVEKILARGEILSAGWPVKGTTGYEFIDRLNRLMVDPDGFARIEKYWRHEINSSWPDFASCVRDSKKFVLKHLFPAELKRLAGVSAISQRIINLPVYRRYDGIDEWQQLSGPVMAKGLEDTAHYRYTPLMALNEVGCSPVSAPLSLAEFCGEKNLPANINTTSTHDTKRSEDVRARLYVLSHMPGEWMDLVAGLRRRRAFDPHVSYIFYQHVAGTWPLGEELSRDYRQRLSGYMLKAIKEMKLKTSWLAPDENYEETVRRFVEDSFDDPEFIKLMDDFVALLAPRAALLSLSVLALKTLSPGFPDFYQGTETWHYLLVDPDNRQVVDFNDLTQNPISTDLPSLRARWRDGAIKRALTAHFLHIRTQIGAAPLWEPLHIKGTGNAFGASLIRGQDNQCWLIVLPLRPPVVSDSLIYDMPPDGTISLPGIYDVENTINEEICAGRRELDLAVILRDFPLALLRLHRSF